MKFSERFKKMLSDTFTSRKFIIGLPIIFVLIWFGKVPGEWGIVAICAIFGINSYDKKKRMEHGQSV